MAAPSDKCSVEAFAVTLWDVQKTHHAGLTLEQCADCGTLRLADDQVTLPMSGLRPVGGIERPLMDGEHRLLEPGATTIEVLMSPVVIAPGPQQGTPVRGPCCGAQQDRSWLIYRLINALVTQPLPGSSG